jgi:hypothetical protein
MLSGNIRRKKVRMREVLQSKTHAPRWLNLEHWFLPLGCMLFLLILIPIGVLGRDIWTDEAFTASYIAHPSLSMVLDDVRKNEETPPVYFIVIWAWGKIFGASEVALRSFSVVAGLLAAFAFARFAQQKVTRFEAVIAVVLFALAPLVSTYMVEGRQYTLSLLLSVLCISIFERLYQSPEHITLLALYSITALTLFLTSYFSFAILAAHNVIWVVLLIRRPENRLKRVWLWCATQGVIGVGVALWLPQLLYQMKVAPAVTAAWGNSLFDYYWLALSLIMHAPPWTNWMGIWFIAAILSWGLIVVSVLRSPQQNSGLVLRVFGVPALILMFMIVFMQVVAPRYMIVLLPGSVLGVAAGFQALRGLRNKLAHMMLLMIVVCMILYRVPLWLNTSVEKPWSALVPHVAQQGDPQRDVVIFHPPWDQRIFAYYYAGPRLPQLGAHNYDTFYYEEGYQLRTSWTRDEAISATKRYRRVWVFYDPMFHQVPRLNLPYKQINHWKSGKLELFLYELPDHP